MSAEKIKQEARNFNRLSRERSLHGFIPDLRRMGDNDYFYLSPFRRQVLAQISFAKELSFLRQALQGCLNPGSTLLDLCCGNGWFTLELARMGYDIIAVDLSEESIQEAQKTYSQADLSPGFGRIRYEVGDIRTWQPLLPDFDAISVRGGLHHLSDLPPVLDRISGWLRKKGLFLCLEPLDQYGETEALLAVLIRVTLSACQAWYEPIDPPETQRQLEELTQETLSEYQTWSDKTESGNQSPLNNATPGSVVLEMVLDRFDCLQHTEILPLTHRLIGGFRLPDESLTPAFAKAWTLIEQQLLDRGLLKPGGFLFLGRKKSA